MDYMKHVFRISVTVILVTVINIDIFNSTSLFHLTFQFSIQLNDGAFDLLKLVFFA